MSQVIADQIEDTDAADLEDFPLAKVSGPILEKVVAYCTQYQIAPMDKIETPLQGDTIEEVVKPKWYADFCEMERETMFDLVAAANFLNIKQLLDLTCLAVSVSIKGKSVEELRDIFHLPAPNTEADEKESDGDEDEDMEP